MKVIYIKLNVPDEDHHHMADLIFAIQHLTDTDATFMDRDVIPKK